MNREDFPIINDNLVYFDNAATTLKPNKVIDSITDYYKNYSVNIHRGEYDLSFKADQAYANAIIGVLSEKHYITQQQSNAITGYHTDPSTGERKSNTAMLMVDEIMSEWRRTCVPEYTETYGGLTAEEVEFIRQQYAAQEAPAAEEKETTPTTR